MMLHKGFVGLSTVLLLGLVCISARADDGGYRKADVRPVDNAEYQNECGACHFAYQPGLLPSRSWKKLMADLEDHFGEDASLDREVTNRLTDYIVRNAAEHSDYRRSRSIANSLGENEAPLRITELRYFRADHREIPVRMFKGNERVRSLSNCNACHRTAVDGNYSERDIEIPGYGFWDD